MMNKLVYLDNSATSYPKPIAVRSAVSSAIVRFGANPGRGGYAMASDTDSAVFAVRKKVSDFFSLGKPEGVVFTGSCTAALNTVIFGLLKPGDHVLISDMEHNSVMRPLRMLRDMNISCTEAEVIPGDDDATLASFRNAMRSNTALIICTAGSNVWGIVPPIAKIAALAHIYGAKICVDAAQAGGVIPLDIKAMGIDYLCLPSHKGLMGIMGAGMLLGEKLGSLKPLIYGGTGDSGELQPDSPPERFESGTLAVPAIISIGAGIDYIKSAGAVYEKEMLLCQRAYKGLSSIPGIKLYTDMPERNLYLPVISFNASVSCEEAALYYSSRNIAVRAGLHCAPEAHRKFGTIEGTVRISPSAFTSVSDIDYFLAVTKFLQNK